MDNSELEINLESKYKDVCLKNGYNLLDKCGEGSYAAVHLAEVKSEAHKRNPNLKEILKRLQTNHVRMAWRSRSLTRRLFRRSASSGRTQSGR
uniref:uncharacterized protein LOC120348465 isoform X2 n=1 Tax=Styela clava TaxID=7725 RepID=UPI001939FCBD|nr:uncharacterized protein LOC120348465 isoform X2 [Styela clava]